MTTDKADNAAQIRFSLPERIRHTSQTTLSASTFPPTIGSNLNMRLAATTEMLPKDPENENTKTLRSNRGLSLWTDTFSERVDVEDIGGDQNAPQNAFQAFQTAKDFEELFGNQQKLVFAGHERITTGLDQPIDLTGFCVALASFAEGEFGSTTFAVWDITGPPTPSTVTFPQQDPISGGGLSLQLI